MEEKSFVIIKGKINSNLDEVLKRILKKLNMNKQEFIEKSVLEFVSKNIFIVMNKDE